MISSGAEAADRKQRIRDRYKGVDTSELEVIPAKTVEGLGESTSIRRVAAYVRVSTDNDEQTSSYELQKNYYTDYIKAQPGWEFVGIYDDEGISGTSLEHRKGMQQLIEDCKAGKIDLILTKSIARFARNIVDCLSVIETLKNLDPPVGVKFEADNIYTLDSNGRMILTILASVAEEESQSKSIIMNWSIDRRFSRGLFLTPALLGYDQDEDGSLVVNQDEAQTVKVIYYLYLNGFSFTEIAELLTEYGRKTKLGNTEGESSTDLVFGAHNLICENGSILAESERFSNQMIMADMDMSKLISERRRMTTWQPKFDNGYRVIDFDLEMHEVDLRRFIDPHPFVPDDAMDRTRRCEEILTIQAMGLKKRLAHTHCRHAVVGISGGLDSTLALLVTVRAFDMLDMDRSQIMAVTMPCFGTTDRT